MPRQETSAQTPNMLPASIFPSVEAEAVSEKPRHGVFYIPQDPEACDLSIWKAEARGSCVQGQPQLLREFEASLGYMRFYKNKAKTAKPILPSCLFPLINQVLTSPKVYESSR